MNQKLQEIVNCIPVVQSMTGTDAAICVWNKDGVVEAFFKSGVMDIVFEIGFQAPDPNDKLYEVLRTGVQAYNKLPREVFGHAFEGTITAIRDGREIVGAITYCFSSEEKDAIVNNTQALTDSLAHTDTSIEGIKVGTRELASYMNKVQSITEVVRAQVEEANKVVETIQKNANYSNILALNASIESARAGQAGKGFAVVSDEMRKFSSMSGEAAQKINGNLVEIVKSLDEMRESINNSTRISEEQADAANHLNEMFDSVLATAQKVNEICRKSNF